MHTINHSILRSILGIILGLLLIMWPELAITYIVIAIGIFFIIPGLYSLIAYLFRDRELNAYSSLFPIIGVGSLLFGIWLVVMPNFFINTFMYILGALLLLASIQQIISLIRFRKWKIVPFVYYIMPVIIFIMGIMILVYPFKAATNTFIIFGVAILLYGICELINWYKFLRLRSKLLKKQETEYDESIIVDDNQEL